MKSYSFFLVFAVIILLCSFVLTDRIFDVRFNNQLFKFHTSNVFRVIALSLLFFWIVYRFAHQKMFSPALTWLHLLSIILFAAFIIIAPYLLPKSQSIDDIFERVQEIQRIRKATDIFFKIAIFGQVFFIVNVLGGFVSNKRAPVKR